MVQVTVRYFAPLNNIIGAKWESVEVPEATIGGLLKVLIDKHKAEAVEKILARRSPSGQMQFRVLVNNEDIEYLKGLETELLNGDQVTFLLPLGGGQTIGGETERRG